MFINTKHAFTLVELLVAVMILAMAIGGVLLLYVTSMISSQYAWDKTAAVAHAEYILEEAQRLDSLDDVLERGWKDWAAARNLNTLPGEKIDVVFSNIQPRLFDMRVTVAWDRKRDSEIVLRTKIAK